jgi:hypothetical protein
LPHVNRASDVAFAVLLMGCAVALAVTPISARLRLLALGVLVALSSGAALYLVLKYTSAEPRQALVGEPHATGRPRGLDGLTAGYTLLTAVWAGVIISVLGNMAFGVGGDLAGAGVSASAGLLLMLDFRGAISGIASSDTAVNFILKPAWLSPSRISWQERMALARATGFAWLVGAVIDVVAATVN